MIRPLLISAALFVSAVSAASAAGTLTERTFDSQALGRSLPAMVYQPDGTPPVNGWPVVYLLHGHGGNDRSWPDLGHIEATLDRLMAKGGPLDPALVVMPDAQNSWYVDSAAVGGPGDYETALTRDLRKAVEADYPVRTDRAGRAVVGLSMGGFGALRFGLAHPQLYSVAASLSGALWQNVPVADLDRTPDELKAIQAAAYTNRVDEATVTAGVILPSVGDHYDGSFGSPFDARRFNAANVFSLLAARLREKADLPALYIACGDDDGFGLWKGAVAFYTAVKSAGGTAELRITDGDHRWSVWTRDVVDALGYVNGRRRALDADVPSMPAPAPSVAPKEVPVAEAVAPKATPAVLAADEAVPVTR